MKKQAVLIICHSQPQIVEKTIRLLDDERFDFYILVDKKSDFADFSGISSIAEKSKVYFVPRISIFWGGSSQIKAELILLENAVKGNYDHYHLISGVDLPLKKPNEFIEFLEKNQGKEFIHFSSPDFADSCISRVKYYYPFQNSRLFNKNEKIKNAALKLQKYLHIERNISDADYCMGSNWFSITGSLADYIIQNKKKILKRYKSTLCCDEVFIQTLVRNSDFRNMIYMPDGNSESNLRYIDWKRGNPYVFRKEDISEMLGSEALFARKFSYAEHPDAVDELFEKLIAK